MNNFFLANFNSSCIFTTDIYSSWIAGEYKVKLDVQSWLNGPHPFESNCTSSELSVYNILTKTISGQSFSTHNDHSKWAVSLSADKPLVCTSDLNRMVSWSCLIVHRFHDMESFRARPFYPNQRKILVLKRFNKSNCIII